jgi:hypothetical protein
MKIEWVDDGDLFYTEDKERCRDVPVVRLAEVDAVIAEAVWAMTILAMDNPEGSLPWAKAKNFLASHVVKELRERQKGKS